MSEERKVVTVLFCDLVGFTTASESADPEDVRRWLAPYHSTLRQTVERYGGTVEKFAGDAILAVFGAPRSREDDAERAVRAGLAILEAVRTLPDGPLEVRIGIETGEALVQLTARPELGEPFVTGMVVNLAARLQSSAPIGAVVVGHGTHEATSRVFGYDALEPVAAKGISRPVERWQAGAPRARFGTDVIRDLSTPMVGRQRDLTLLCTAFEKAVAERVPQFVTLLGEPGIGKSRLVAEFGAWLDQHDELVTWREGRSLPYGETPFGPIAEIFKVQAGILDTDPPAQAVAKLDAIVPDGADRAWLRARVGPLVGADQSAHPESAAQEESFAAWRQLLESFGEQSPVVLVFEDLHWATDAMLAFVDHLAEWLTDLPLLVVVTARPELLERGPQWTRGVQNSLTVGVAPLTADETDQLLSRMFGGQDVPAEIRRLLVRRADGNPLYAEELARVVADCGPDQAGSADLPIGIAALIAARLDTLEPDRKALLADAAVIGPVFWAEAVAALSDRDPGQVVQALQELARKELVRPVRRSSMLGQHEYTFWHALTRDVAYSQVPRAARSARHLAAADWLELRCAACQAETPNLIAYHLSTALDLAAALGDPEAAAAIAPRAREYQLMAAELAMNLDTNEALALLDRALALSPAGDPERPTVLLRWGWAAFQAGRLDDAQAAYLEAIAGFEAIGDIRGVALALRASTYSLSSMEESLATVDRAVGMLEELGPSEDLALLLSGQASIRVVASRYQEAIDSANSALRIATEQGYAVPHRALESRGLARVGLGDTGGLVDVKEALTALLEGGGGPRCGGDVAELRLGAVADRGTGGCLGRAGSGSRVLRPTPVGRDGGADRLYRPAVDDRDRSVGRGDRGVPGTTRAPLTGVHPVAAHRGPRRAGGGGGRGRPLGRSRSRRGGVPAGRGGGLAGHDRGRGLARGDDACARRRPGRRPGDPAVADLAGRAARQHRIRCPPAVLGARGTGRRPRRRRGRPRGLRRAGAADARVLGDHG